MKYKPIKLSINDFIFWINNARIPERIIVRSKDNINYFFEISFEVKGKNGPFYNKRFFLDDKELFSEEECVEYLKSINIIYNDIIKVYETFDYNKPEVLIGIINDLKGK